MMVIDEQRSHQPKPPKLRSACNQCNAAKVKCSGELSGCTRCQDFGTECIYVESRVGKVQGVRTKRRKSQHKPMSLLKDATCQRAGDNHVHTETNSENSEAITESSHVPSQRPNNSPPTSLDQALQEWSSESWATEMWDESTIDLDAPAAIFHDVNENFSAASLNGSAQLINATTSSIENSNNIAPFNISLCIDGAQNCTSVTGSSVAGPDPNSLSHLPIAAPPSPNMADPTQGPTCTNLSQDRPFEPPRTSALDGGSVSQFPATACAEETGSTAKLDSKCVLACTNIIIMLENYLLFELKVLDLILSTVRSSTDEVHKIVQHQQESRCDRCMFLFTTILSQLVALLEVGSRVTNEEEPLSHKELLPSRPLNIAPKFSFGAFTIDAEEQKSWKIHMIRRECQHVRQILGRIIALAMLGPKGSPPATPDQHEERSKCYKGIEQRLKALCESTGHYTT